MRARFATETREITPYVWLRPDASAVRVLGPDYINAIASKLEHNTTRPAATSARNPSDTKSSLRMVHLPMAMLVRIY